MKPILQLIVPAALLLCGCEDFLDLKPKGKEIPTTLEQYEGMLNNTMFSNISNQTQNADGSISPGSEPVYIMYMSDELTADAESFASLDRNSLAAYTYQADLFNQEDRSAEWNAPYQQIYSYNVIVNGVMDATEGSEEDKLRVQSEARVGRAYMHFLLAQFFGKPYNAATASTDLCVPIVTEASVGNRTYERNTVQEVYDFVLRELEDACPHLAQTTIHRQRIYRCAGYYMLGKVYFMMGRYGDARQALLTAMDASQDTTIGLELFDYNTKLTEWGYSPALGFMFGLTGSYPSNFDNDNTELICNKQINIMPIVFFAYPPFVYIKSEYMALYGEDDLRRAFFNNLNYTGSVQYPYYKRIQRMVCTLAGDMPDLYLMLAESQARTGHRAEAEDLLTEFRAHRMPAESAAIPASVVTDDDLVRFIVDERMREFMMTGLRWFDLRRLWNDPLFPDLQANCTHTDGTNTYTLTEERLTYRIPPQVLSFSTDWTDNE